MSKSSAKQVVSKPNKPKRMKCYAIRDADSGLYSTGGTCPKWSAVGKRWSSIGHVKNHLLCWSENGGYQERPIPRHWQVVEFELVESENDSDDYPIHAWTLKA